MAYFGVKKERQVVYLSFLRWRRDRGDFENRPLSYDCQTVMNEFVLFHQEFMHIRKHKTQHCNSMFASVYRQSYI